MLSDLVPVLEKVKLVSVKSNKRFNGQGRFACDLSDDRIGASENAVLVVDRDRTEMLDEKRWESLRLQPRLVLCNRGRLVRYRGTECVTDGAGNLRLA